MMVPQSQPPEAIVGSSLSAVLQGCDDSISPPSPSGIRGIRWVAQSIDLWLVSRGHLMTPLKYSDRHLAGLFAGPPDRVELIGAGSLGYGTGPSFG